MPDTHLSSDTKRMAAAEAVPPAGLLHYAGLLSGFGTAFLGPSLPALSAAMHLSDRGAGTLLAAQFTGAFLGGWTTRSPLRNCLLRGYGAAFVGFALLACSLTGAGPANTAIGHALPLLALLLLGFGIGQIITCNNLLAALRWAQHRGAALTLLNFTWSAGALCAPLLLPALLRRTGAAPVFAVFDVLLLAGAFLTVLLPSLPVTPQQSQAGAHGLPLRAFLYFCLLLLVYGGVETSLSGWLTTYDLRYRGATQAFAVSTAAFWFCLTGARAVASALLLRLPERIFLRAGLAAAVVILALLLAFGHGGALPVLAGLAGAALAPWFPLVFSGLVSEHPTAAQAGRIVAVSGLGAAALPWLVGAVSSRTGSLREALLLPIAGTIVLFLLSFRSSTRPNFVP